MASSYTIVEKITNVDADLRIVATADLHKGLASGPLRLGGDQERKIYYNLQYAVAATRNGQVEARSGELQHMHQAPGPKDLRNQC